MMDSLEDLTPLEKTVWHFEKGEKEGMSFLN